MPWKAQFTCMGSSPVPCLRLLSDVNVFGALFHCWSTLRMLVTNKLKSFGSLFTTLFTWFRSSILWHFNTVQRERRRRIRRGRSSLRKRDPPPHENAHLRLQWDDIENYWLCIYPGIKVEGGGTKWLIMWRGQGAGVLPVCRGEEAFGSGGRAGWLRTVKLLVWSQAARSVHVSEQDPSPRLLPTSWLSLCMVDSAVVMRMNGWMLDSVVKSFELPLVRK